MSTFPSFFYDDNGNALVRIRRLLKTRIDWNQNVGNTHQSSTALWWSQFVCSCLVDLPSQNISGFLPFPKSEMKTKTLPHKIIIFCRYSFTFYLLQLYTLKKYSNHIPEIPLDWCLKTGSEIHFQKCWHEKIFGRNIIIT